MTEILRAVEELLCSQLKEQQHKEPKKGERAGPSTETNCKEKSHRTPRIIGTKAKLCLFNNKKYLQKHKNHCGIASLSPSLSHYMLWGS